MVKTTEKYIHKVDKSLIPVCNILGVDIAALDMDWLLDFTGKHIKELSGDYLCVSNVHTTVTVSYTHLDVYKRQAVEKVGDTREWRRVYDMEETQEAG